MISMGRVTQKTKSKLIFTNEFEGINENFSFIDSTDKLETQETVENLIYKKENEKVQMINMLKKETLQEVLKEIPEKNVSYHLISNGTYDFFTFIPVLTEMMNNNVNEFYGSTWTLNRPNLKTLFELYDTEKIKQINILTGTYFKRRESAVYSMLLIGILERKQRYKCFENHSKIVLLSNQATDDYIVIEGSANFTANPRVEQYVINNHKGLYYFHKNWMDDFLND